MERPRSSHPQIIVLDDDPTGSQTLHSCLLLLRWDIETLRLGLRDDANIFFVLTNTRSMPESEAIATTRAVCRNLKIALKLENVERYLLVSRSDSTLRGHYPAEIEAIAAELGEFDAHFLVPAFFEGGRITRGSRHYIADDHQEIPVHHTEFAQDKIFGFRDSFLPNYVAEKTQGRILAEKVKRLQLETIRQGCLSELLSLAHNQCVVVDGEQQSDLDRFVQDIMMAADQGKRFLFRSAASLLTSLAGMGQQPVLEHAIAENSHSNKPGIILIGSHVQKTTEQLQTLLKLETVKGIEIDVEPMADMSWDATQLLQHTLAEIQQVYDAGFTPVIYTSRQYLDLHDRDENLRFGQKITDLLMALIQYLPKDIRFMLSKGGNTSHNLLSQGLSLRQVRLIGQIMAGCCLVKTDADHPHFPNLPVVLFPGNVGDRQGLVRVYQRLKGA